MAKKRFLDDTYKAFERDRKSMERAFGGGERREQPRKYYPQNQNQNSNTNTINVNTIQPQPIIYDPNAAKMRLYRDRENARYNSILMGEFFRKYKSWVTLKVAIVLLILSGIFTILAPVKNTNIIIEFIFMFITFLVIIGLGCFTISIFSASQIYWRDR